MSPDADYQPFLDAIAARQPELERTLVDWCEINSGSAHVAGIEAMLAVLTEAFGRLGATGEHKSLAPQRYLDAAGEERERELGAALLLCQRPEAPVQILLTGHFDTVFPPQSDFQQARISAERLHGPGAADMKGGLLVMLSALEALEQSPWRDRVGYRVLLNPDEEIGSPGSAALLETLASEAQLGMTYEPALADGTLAGARKGSGNFSLRVRGRSAHAGRAPQDGRNAIVLAARFAAAVDALNDHDAGISVNPARIDGGAPNNVVPDNAVLRFNIRVRTVAQQQAMEQALERLLEQYTAEDGFNLELHGGFARPPKELTPRNLALFELLADTGRQLGLNLQWQPTGGCCDGNNLAAAGLPNIDTLGVCGNHIHSDAEYMLRDSLRERAQLSALLLLRLARGDIRAP